MTKGGGGVLFCLVDSLLGFACFNDCFTCTLFFVPCLFAIDLGKLQNTNVRKETCQYLPLQMSTCNHEIKCKRDEELYLLLHCNLTRNFHRYLVHIPLFLLDVWVLEVVYRMAASVILVV
jgi:hypothetical protein